MTNNAVQRMIDNMTNDEVREHLRFLLTAAESAQGAHLDDLLAQYNACLAATRPVTKAERREAFKALNRCANARIARRSRTASTDAVFGAAFGR